MADLVVTSVNPTTAPDSVVWCSDPQNVIKDAPLLVYLEIISTVQCSSKGNGTLTPKQSAVVDPSGRGTDETAAAFISQRNGFLYLHEMRAYKRRILRQYITLDILRGCKKYNVTKLLIETNFGDGIVSELFKKHLQQTKQK